MPTATISFQGACFFNRNTANVNVYLPKATDGGLIHADGDVLPPHYPAIFVLDKYKDSVDGFEECEFEYSPTEKVKGRVFRLGGSPTSPTFDVRISPQTGSLKKDNLDSLISFSSFAPGLPLVPSTDRLAARMSFSGGRFYADKAVPPRGLAWVMPLVEEGGTLPLDPAWRVRWDPYPRQSIKIEVYADGVEVASIKAEKPESGDTAVIIGNLDEQNAARWSRREKKKIADCVDVRGRPLEYCDDLDFKWLFQLFDPREVDRRFGRDGANTLPAPRLNGDPRQAEGAALDTPTCFPGGD